MESFKLHRKAAILIQALARKAIQRPIFLSELAEARENTKLENQLLALQRKLEKAEERRLEAEKKAEDARNAAPVVVSAPATEQVNSQVAQNTELNAQQQALMDESGKMLEYLRKEVFKLRSQNAHLRQDYDTLKANNQKMIETNASAGASFAALNNHAKHLGKSNQKLMADLSAQKNLVSNLTLEQVELKEELKMKQATYIAEVHSRLQYQRTLNHIVDIIQLRCRDDRLVDDVLALSDDCEADYMNGPTGMDVRAPAGSTSGVSDMFKSLSSVTNSSPSKGITQRFFSFFGGGEDVEQEESQTKFSGFQTFAGGFSEAD